MVGPRMRAHLCALFPHAVFVSSWNEVAGALEACTAAIVLFDPSLVPDGARSAVDLSTRFAGIPFVVYALLEPKTFQTVVQYASLGFTDVVLFGFEDDRGRLEHLFDDVRARVSQPALPAALVSRLASLPPQLRSAVGDLMRDPQRYRTAQDVAVGATMSTRAVFRHFKLAGLASPRRLVASARLLQAYSLLANRQLSVADVARRLGYHSPDQLSRHFTEIAGVAASAVRRGLVTREQFISSLVHALLGENASVQQVTNQ